MATLKVHWYRTANSRKMSYTKTDVHMTLLRSGYHVQRSDKYGLIADMVVVTGTNEELLEERKKIDFALSLVHRLLPQCTIIEFDPS